MFVDNDGGAFYLANQEGNHVVESYASPEGDGLLILSDRDAATRIESIANQASGTLRLWDESNDASPARIFHTGDQPDSE